MIFLMHLWLGNHENLSMVIDHDCRSRSWSRSDVQINIVHQYHLLSAVLAVPILLLLATCSFSFPFRMSLRLAAQFNSWDVSHEWPASSFIVARLLSYYADQADQYTSECNSISSSGYARLSPIAKIELISKIVGAVVPSYFNSILFWDKPRFAQTYGAFFATYTRPLQPTPIVCFFASHGSSSESRPSNSQGCSITAHNAETFDGRHESQSIIW